MSNPVQLSLNKIRSIQMTPIRGSRIGDLAVTEVVVVLQLQRYSSSIILFSKVFEKKRIDST